MAFGQHAAVFLQTGIWGFVPGMRRPTGGCFTISRTCLGQHEDVPTLVAIGNYFVVGMPLEVNGACRQKSDTDCTCSGCSHASIQYGVPKLGQLNSGKNGDTICSSIELIYLLQGCFNHK